VILVLLFSRFRVSRMMSLATLDARVADLALHPPNPAHVAALSGSALPGALREQLAVARARSGASESTSRVLANSERSQIILKFASSQRVILPIAEETFTDARALALLR